MTNFQGLKTTKLILRLTERKPCELATS